MDPSARETDINPYLPPSDTEHPSVPKGPAVLKDLRLRGWLALTAISLQCLIGFAILFYPFQSQVMLVRVQFVTAVSLSLSMILFLRWLHGVAVNTLRINPLSGIGTGWSVGCYFVPFVNWVAPCAHMRAFIRECHPEGAPAGMQGLAVAWWVSFQLRGLPIRILPKAGVGEMVGWAAWVACTLVSWVTVWFLVTRISQRHFEFRWSDLPAARRPRILDQMAKMARLKEDPPLHCVPAGGSLPPRRLPQRPIPIDEQNRLFQELQHQENPDPPP